MERIDEEINDEYCSSSDIFLAMAKYIGEHKEHLLINRKWITKEEAKEMFPDNPKDEE